MAANKVEKYINIDIPDNVFADIFHQLERGLTEKESEKLLPKIQAVRTAAESFIEKSAKIEEINNKYNEQKKAGRKFSASFKGDSGFLNFIDKRNELQEEVFESWDIKKDIDAFFKAQLNYLDKIQDLMGQEMYFVFVDSNNGTIYEESLKDLLNKDLKETFSYNFSASEGGKKTARIEMKFKKNGIGKEKKIDPSKITHQKALQQIYEAVLERGRYSKTKMKEKSQRNAELARGRSLKGDYFKYKDGTELILWKPKSKWIRGFVVNEGDIAEAYAGFSYALSMGALKDEFFQGNLENRINNFMTGEGDFQDGDILQWKGLGGVLGVDNEKGTYRGDFGYGKKQYAAKTLGSTFQGYKDDLDTAKRLVNVDDKELVRTLARDFVKTVDNPATRNKILKNGSKEASARYTGLYAGPIKNLSTSKAPLISIGGS